MVSQCHRAAHDSCPRDSSLSQGVAQFVPCLVQNNKRYFTREDLDFYLLARLCNTFLRPVRCRMNILFRPLDLHPRASPLQIYFSERAASSPTPDIRLQDPGKLLEHQNRSLTSISISHMRSMRSSHTSHLPILKYLLLSLVSQCYESTAQHSHGDVREREREHYRLTNARERRHRTSHPFRMFPPRQMQPATEGSGGPQEDFPAGYPFP